MKVYTETPEKSSQSESMDPISLMGNLYSLAAVLEERGDIAAADNARIMADALSAQLVADGRMEINDEIDEDPEDIQFWNDCREIEMSMMRDKLDRPRIRPAERTRTAPIIRSTRNLPRRPRQRAHRAAASRATASATAPPGSDDDDPAPGEAGPNHIEIIGKIQTGQWAKGARLVA
jgi:hypothetical protein